jgi:Fe-S-cluster containining protein
MTFPARFGQGVSDDYRSILARADAHFARVAREEWSHLECRKGCTGCCHGLFEIGAADVSILADALRRLEPQLRETLIRRAEAVLEATYHPDLRALGDADREAFLDATEGVPCPALDRGSCLVYPDRPLLCRTFGLPIRDGSEYMGDECELNFTEAGFEVKERVAWDLQWEDAIGVEDQYTVPEGIVLAARALGYRD